MRYDETFLKLVKEKTLEALLSDDNIMDKLVFKGGNAIAMIYKISDRASMDLDFSMENDFTPEEKQNIHGRIEKLLERSFKRTDYNVVNFDFKEKPRVSSNKFWGGYEISFQLIDNKRLKELPTKNKEILGRNTRPIYDDIKKFTVDISKYEYCASKKPQNFEGYTVYVYTPEMIVFEKIRSICQQTEEYKQIVKCSISSRARDFFDIYTIMKSFEIDISTNENLELLKAIFDVKKVPLKLIFEINKYHELHKNSFDVLKGTVAGRLESFDFYFNYLLKKIKNLKGNITSRFPNILD